jgi:hypothetical protein
MDTAAEGAPAAVQWKGEAPRAGKSIDRDAEAVVGAKVFLCYRPVQL